MQLEIILVEIAVEHVRMLQSHLLEFSSPVHIRYLPQCRRPDWDLANHRIHEYSAVLIDPFDARGVVKQNVLRLAEELMELGSPVLFWSRYATSRNVPHGACFMDGHEREHAARIVAWLRERTRQARPKQPEFLAATARLNRRNTPGPTVVA